MSKMEIDFEDFSFYIAIFAVILTVIFLSLFIDKFFPVPGELSKLYNPTERINEPAYVLKDKILIVEFIDFECPSCKEFQKVVGELQKKYPEKISIQFKHFPNPENQYSLKAALAAECARDEDKFNSYAFELFKEKIYSDNQFAMIADKLGMDMTLFESCYSTNKYYRTILTDVDEGKTLGIRGTPTVFMNGLKIEGAYNFDELETLYLSELKRLKE